MLKSDFHIHTGDDPVDRIDHTIHDLVDFAAEKDFQVLAVTNHSAMIFSSDTEVYAAEKGILLIPGIECSIEGKHVIVLNPPGGCIEHVNTFEELKKYREQNPAILVMAPHPFYPKHHCLGELLIKYIDLFDAIEYSHCYLSFLNPYNEQAAKVAETYNKPLVGTSDLHHFCQMDYTYSMVDSEQTIAGVINALKSGAIEVVTRPMSYYAFGRMVLAMGINDIYKVLKSIGRIFISSQ